MNDEIIPLTSSPNQTFSVTLKIDGAPLTLNLAIRWSAMAGYWVMTIANSAGIVLLDSIPILTGWYPAANILAQSAYLRIGSAFVINEGNTTDDYPSSVNLGNGFRLLWSDTPAR